MPPLKDKITVGSRVTIAAEAELRGEISIGTGTVIHPRATILAIQGPIVIGSNCIVEELAVILNRGPGIMKIGDENLFEVGCRIETPRIGNHNTFEPRSKVSQSVLLGSFSTIGAGCTLTSGIRMGRSSQNPNGEGGGDLGYDEVEDILSFSETTTNERESKTSSSSTIHPHPASNLSSEESSSPASSITIGNANEDQAADSEEKSGLPLQKDAPREFQPEQFPDNLVIYGADSRSRIWSGEGVKQAAALHSKHLSYLQENIPKFHKLKIIQ